MAVDDDYDSSGLTTSVDALGHDHPDVAEYAALASDLRDRVEGAVMFDEYAQILYATDGSIYQARPAGAVCPRDVADVQGAVEVAADHDVPILPRGTGSSLGGQTVGPGCVVLDLSRHMDDILDVSPGEKRATVQPGVVQDHLDDALAEHGLKFAPDPASSNRATIGGGIGNNSTGAHSVRYGITDAYTERLRVVLADGSIAETREIVLDSEEWDAVSTGDSLEARLYRTVREAVEENQDAIAERYPDLKRNVSGYTLDRVIYENEAGDECINLSTLFVGSEGTLGVVVEAELGLVTKPAETALALYFFDDLLDAMKAVPQALEYDVSAVELMDDELFDLARDSAEFAQYAEPIPGDAAAALMLEYDSELHDDFEAAIAATDERFLANGDAFDTLAAYSDAAQDDLWKLRKAAIPLLMGMQGDPKPYPFIEDATVPPDELAEYVQSFQDVLHEHGTSAAYFAHAGAGTLHIRPILNLKDEDGIEAMHSITEDVTDLVLEHHGSFSGEHGDGLARTEFNPKMYGPDIWQAFKDVKSAADPDWLMNPGTVVYREDNPTDTRDHLRYGAAYQSVEPQTEQDFTEEGGFSHLVELCNGCGTCRQTDSDTMCPTYRASGEEIQTTRGRANLLRAAISGELDEDELHSERFTEEVLDLCIGCKGCQSDCPTGVDMAKLKTEVKHDYHQEHGAGLRERLFANIDTVSKVGSMLAPVSNWGTSLPGARAVMESVLGIHRDRELPTFRRDTLETWLAERTPQVSEADAERKALLFPDTYTNYSYPEPGKAAVRVLEAAGVHVELAEDVTDSGRAAYSKGFLDAAKESARENVDALAAQVEAGWDVVFVEPSDAVMFQDEYRDFFPGTERAEAVAASAFGVCEYLDTYRLGENVDWTAPAESLSYHGHCNQKATNKDHHAVGVLRRAGYTVDAIDSGCCGMAGSFGYEDEHYELSQAIGRRLFRQVEESDGDQVVAPGASCRSQLGDRDGASTPPHPIERLEAAL
ncbi:FAD-binding and (Fe-S)-binding domain-containing protein [Salarchaeum sp. JOR-1]|uniref:FAD-binding and (Fe-S)-binding domain-containing protein n=1 Tax=Salarchaeum sp. JOR-1 TaxID=2599399 RepID=UPI0011985BD9|nr:FAD-binding and (Fe-S)-binding domain-containing protein [Salarchaeum sp. JOR-1]QDX39469.1 FAD-binding protein [Salarchaeum sp. JOR-1]